MTKTICTTLSDEFYEYGKIYNLSWSEAMRVGISILLIERGETKFKNQLNRIRVQNLIKHYDERI